MTDRTEDEHGSRESEDDLRSLALGRSAAWERRQPTPGKVDSPTDPEEEPTPYVPPVRPGDQPVDEEEPVPYEPPVRDYDEPRRDWREPRQEQSEPEPQEPQGKLPPVWPGDENQPWFRRERGLPPLPGSDGETDGLSPEDLPTELAEIPARARAFGVSTVLPQAIGMLLAPVGLFIATIVLFGNLFLFRQGQDLGAALFGLRVLRDNGDVAGFYHMFVRSAASIISLLAAGAGFWSAYSDPERRTWHDRWLKTYVVKDAPEYRTRKRSSSEIAFSWFWIIMLLAIAVTVMAYLNSSVEVIEVTPTPGPGEGSGGGEQV